MKLQTANDNDCVAASVAMLIGVNHTTVKEALWPDPPVYPFPEPWQVCPLVPCMDIICDWLYTEHKVALTPFAFDPHVTPHKDCPPVSACDEDPMSLFEGQLAYGPGLIEGVYSGVGHMCAWDGNVIYDPHGYKYSLNAAGRFNFTPTRFWLASWLQ